MALVGIILHTDIQTNLRKHFCAQKSFLVQLLQHLIVWYTSMSMNLAIAAKNILKIRAFIYNPNDKKFSNKNTHSIILCPRLATGTKITKLIYIQKVRQTINFYTYAILEALMIKTNAIKTAYTKRIKHTRQRNI